MMQMFVKRHGSKKNSSNSAHCFQVQIISKKTRTYSKFSREFSSAAALSFTHILNGTCGGYFRTSRPLGIMKMLQALVGYLAITALHFYPFVFAASSLASINRDGYANKTHIDDALIKQVLDNIVETCPGQTVTTQKRGDSAVREIVSGDIIESRQEGIPPPPPPLIIATLLVAVIIGIAWILDDNYVRDNDAEFLVEHLIRSRVFY